MKISDAETGAVDVDGLARNWRDDHDVEDDPARCEGCGYHGAGVEPDGETGLAVCEACQRKLELRRAAR